MPIPVTPKLAADIIIELNDAEVDGISKPIVLIERANPPHGWAIPGGFVDVGESVEAAAVREAEEETGLVVSLQAMLGVYSDPTRDARGHCVSTVFVATATGTPIGQDDAKLARLYAPGAWPELAFDHAQILADYLYWREHGISPRWNMSTN